MAGQSIEIFCFNIDNQRFAISLSSVHRILRAVAVTPVPNSPVFIYGLIDYYGEIVPVINLRYRLNHVTKPIHIDDIFVIADTSKRRIALVVDEAEVVLTPASKDLFASSDLDSGIEAHGILRQDNGIIFIYDLEKFLSEEEEILMQEAMNNQTSGENKV